MGGSSSKRAASLLTPASTLRESSDNIEDNGDDQMNKPDASISSDIRSPEEAAAKKKAYAKLRSAYAEPSKTRRSNIGSSSKSTNAPPHTNLIENIYNEDFDTIDHIQAMRLPPMVAHELKSAVRDEAERHCAETEKTMARCLQDKMWTSWKCQKERDVYFHCVEDVERRNLRPDPARPEWTDMLTAFRWKYNLGVFHGEVIGRNNIMKSIWTEHYPDRDLPHPWVKDT